MSSSTRPLPRFILTSAKRLIPLDTKQFLTTFRSALAEFSGVTLRDGCKHCPDWTVYAKVTCFELNATHALVTEDVPNPPTGCRVTAAFSLCLYEFGPRGEIGIEDPTCCREQPVDVSLGAVTVEYDTNRDKLIIRAYAMADGIRAPYYFFYGEVDLCDLAETYPTIAISNMLTDDDCFTLPGTNDQVGVMAFGGAVELTISCGPKGDADNIFCPPCPVNECPTSISGSTHSFSGSIPPTEPCEADPNNNQWVRYEYVCAPGDADWFVNNSQTACQRSIPGPSNLTFVWDPGNGVWFTTGGWMAAGCCGDSLPSPTPPAGPCPDAP